MPEKRPQAKAVPVRAAELPDVQRQVYEAEEQNGVLKLDRRLTAAEALEQDEENVAIHVANLRKRFGAVAAPSSAE